MLRSYFSLYAKINASDYGVPQNRRRAIIIGKLNGAAPKLPTPKDEKVTIWDAISDLAYLESGEGTDEQEAIDKLAEMIEKGFAQ